MCGSTKHLKSGDFALKIAHNGIGAAYLILPVYNFLEYHHVVKNRGAVARLGLFAGADSQTSGPCSKKGPQYACPPLGWQKQAATSTDEALAEGLHLFALPCGNDH